MSDNHMAAERILLLWGRHGVAPQKPEGGSMDELVPESVTRLHGKGQQYQEEIAALGATVDTSLQRYTNKVRTQYTGQALIAGALGLVHANELEAPRSQEDLAGYNLRGLNILPERGFNIGRPNINMAVYKDPQRGPNACLDYWLANPNATEHEGEPIESFNSIYERALTGSRMTLTTALDADKRFGVVTGHATTIEPVVLGLVNSGRTIPVEKIADIGGGFGMEEVAEMYIERSGSVYTARLNIKGQDHRVDLGRLLHG